MRAFSLTLMSLLSLSIAHPTVNQPRTAECDAGQGISDAQAQQVQAAFVSSGLVPLIAPEINPTTDLEANYNGKSIDLGQTFTTVETVPSPDVTFTAEKDCDPVTTNYTFFIVDPDAPSPDAPALRYFLHAIYYNVHPSCVSGSVIEQASLTSSEAKALAPYLSPTPLSVAAHRYTFLIYRQPPGVFKPQLQIGEADRAMFDLQGFVDAGKLELVGGNFFLEGIGSTVTGVAGTLSTA